MSSPLREGAPDGSPDGARPVTGCTLAACRSPSRGSVAAACGAKTPGALAAAGPALEPSSATGGRGSGRRWSSSQAGGCHEPGGERSPRPARDLASACPSRRSDAAKLWSPAAALRRVALLGAAPGSSGGCAMGEVRQSLKALPPFAGPPSWPSA